MAERRKFDPERMAAKRQAAGLFATPHPATPDPATPHPTPADRPLSVAQLASVIDTALKAGTPARVRVRGEVSGFKRQTHWYFALKDTQALIGCVMFASSARRHEPLRDGQEVIATGRIEFFAKSGRTQLYVDRIEPVGAGALEAQFRALCEELRASGWFGPAGKKPLPTFPRRVAVVTSLTGAALQDVLDTARRRCPAVELLLVDVRVQGEQAAPQIVRALAQLGQLAGERAIDAVLLTRGGGSIEDLWAFNERAVAEAIRACPVPVVAAIGHESDVTIAELVADERAATPTQAAMRLIPDRLALREQAEQLGRRLASLVTRELSARSAELRLLSRRPALADPGRTLAAYADQLRVLRAQLPRAATDLLRARRERLHTAALRLASHRPEAVEARRRERLRQAQRRLGRAAAGLLIDRRSELDALTRELHAVSPQAVLGRGYSITFLARADAGPGERGPIERGPMLRSPSEAPAGATLVTLLAGGEVVSVAQRPGSGGAGEARAADRGAAPAPPAPPARGRSPGRRGGPPGDDGRSQLDLFTPGG